jgi:hypothetical protein
LLRLLSEAADIPQTAMILIEVYTVFNAYSKRRDVIPVCSEISTRY